MVWERTWCWCAYDRRWCWCRFGRVVEVSCCMRLRSSDLNEICRWSTKHPLHLLSEYSGSVTSSPIPTTTSAEQDLRSSVSVSPDSPVGSSILHSRMMTASAMPVIVDHPATHMDPNSSGDSSNESFTTAFAMLLYNVCYLAYTQSVDIPLSQAGDALSNLWAVCCSTDLGRLVHMAHLFSGESRTHITFPQAFTCNDTKPAPTHPADVPS
jgi:hypothetical protein